MSRTAPNHAHEPPRTSGDLIEFWRVLDEAHSAEEAPQRPSSRDGTLMMARWATGLFIATIMLTIGPLLRAVGSA